MPPIDAARYTPPVTTAAPPDLVQEAAALLKSAKRPVILAGRTSRSEDAWNARVALAEALNARVITDLKIGASFPTDHPLYVGAAHALTPDSAEALRAADVILSLDWVDLAGALKLAPPSPAAKIIQVSLDYRIHNGWSMDYQGLPTVDLFISADPDAVVPELVKALGAGGRPRAAPPPRAAAAGDDPPGFTNEHIARVLRKVIGERPVTLTHLPISWEDRWWTFRHPLDFLGSDGGGGVGGGPGISVGAALALKNSGRLPVAVCGDGDFLMGVTAVWTAVHYKIPLLFVIANNRSFYNDELHQERVARMRDRPIENKWIGQRMADPEIDIAAMGRAQGALGFGPITNYRRSGAGAGKSHRRCRCRRCRRGRCARRAGLYRNHDRRDDAREKLKCEETPMNTAAPVKSAKAETLRLPEHRDAFYGGEWHKPKSGKYVDSINPGTGESLGPFADCGADDIDAAVQAARRPSTAGATRRRSSARACSSASPRSCAKMPTSSR